MSATIIRGSFGTATTRTPERKAWLGPVQSNAAPSRSELTMRRLSDGSFFVLMMASIFAPWAVFAAIAWVVLR